MTQIMQMAFMFSWAAALLVGARALWLISRPKRGWRLPIHKRAWLWYCAKYKTMSPYEIQNLANYLKLEIQFTGKIIAGYSYCASYWEVEDTGVIVKCWGLTEPIEKRILPK